MSRRALVLLNPAAGSSRRLLRRDGLPAPRLDRLLALLGGGGFDCELAPTRAPGHAAELARAAGADGGFAVVFAIGGDGMLRETATGLLGGELPLAPLPAGTANVLARALDIPVGLERAAERFAGAAGYERVALDVGLVVGDRAHETDRGPATDDPGPLALPFLMMASRGLDARALEHLPLAWKRRLGRSGVALSGLRELARRPDPPFVYRVDGAGERRAAFLAVCNIPFYGGRFVLAPGAQSNDRALDVVSLEAPGRRALLGFALRVLIGRSRPGERVRSVSMPGRGSAGMQVDGDAVRVSLPARIALAAETLPILRAASDHRVTALRQPTATR